MHGRVFFVTEDGHVGTGPEDVIPGEQVLMLGYPVQVFVMRPVPAVCPRMEDDRSWAPIMRAGVWMHEMQVLLCLCSILDILATNVQPSLVARHSSLSIAMPSRNDQERSDE